MGYFIMKGRDKWSEVNSELKIILRTFLRELYINIIIKDLRGDDSGSIILGFIKFLYENIYKNWFKNKYD